MSEEKLLQKGISRKCCLAQRAGMGEKERHHKSRLIQEKILALPEYKRAQAVMLFLNFRDEVETTDLAEITLAMPKRLILPRCAPRGTLLPIEVRNLRMDLEPGRWGIREPKLNLDEIEPSEIDLILVPGAGFDLRGNRVGYGGGFYDRFFERLKPTVPRIAIAFECQVVDEVPVAEHDVQMTMLITEKNVYHFESRE
ncbi:5-formyltetrahydrofolate cyclo-ligase [Desulfosporosinus acidiphilus SJ4]|uniref:5-formyltetrahydrofolate cyclo-ligase n=1 Tax=Desulfosporosinus acidiphilus (strain DSM 22704 / JCM 16185 / SJ4) TaxID=646529 RepID=I4D211_DESAJ|nr:5-formyltetrahydrofolate cyclo-ligase [Desulfosporosinus acidiphilus]AFM39835.1 5-formyltetrahydrofolate cyclo-ligase [Desulfosporosinus acidiphilus SJ4]